MCSEKIEFAAIDDMRLALVLIIMYLISAAPQITCFVAYIVFFPPWMEHSWKAFI